MIPQKPIIKNPIKINLLLEFEAAFPNEPKKPPEEYLKGGNRNIILKVASFFLGFKNQKSKYEDSREALGMMFREENIAFANEVYQRILLLEKKGNHVQIFNAYSSLTLFEVFFKSTEEKEVQTEAEFEVNLFKAYLSINSDFTRKQSKALLSTKEIEKELQLPMMMFCMSYALSDKVIYNINEIWTTQAIKAMYLFQFFETEQRTKTLLTAFLSYFNCTSWEEYLKQLLPLTFSAINKENESFTDIIIEAGPNFRRDCDFIEKLIVKEEDEIDENDFLSIRAKPFYKIKDGIYRPIFGLFVVEKIFKGVYFLLRDINNKLPKQDRISDLKSLIGEEFSEKILLYEIIKLIYPDKNILFSGKEFTEMKIDGAPDFYVRKGKNILLFESKDFLIPASIKNSFDFAQYENEFEKKLYFEEVKGKEKYKAVMQLINSIRGILKKEFKVDTNYNYRDISIYPVLITHDHQYDVGGLNYLINYWFQAELEELSKEGYFIRKVKPLIIVNIDCLIYHQVVLQKNIPLHEVLNLYLEQVHTIPGLKFSNQKAQEEYLTSKLIPFSFFINDYFFLKNFKEMPPMLDSLGLALFKDENQKPK